MGGKHLQEAVPDGSAAVRYQPYPEYTLTNDERLLQLPVHWNIAPLRYLLNEPLTNGLFKKREHWGSGLRIVNVFDVYIKGDVVQETSLERVSCDITEQKKYSAEHGDFFFVRSSLKLEGIGKSASVINPTEPMVFECHLVRGRPNTDTVCPKYLSYILNSSYCRQSLISLANQVTMTTIDQEKFKSLKISYPDLHEQQTIAEFLDYKTAKIDALIAKKKALLDKLLEKRTALISHAVTKGLDPKTPMHDSGIDWLGEIPAHWEVKRLKFLSTKIGSGVTPRGGATVYQDSGIPLLRSQNIHFDGLKLHDVAFIEESIHADMKNSQVLNGDVLLNITGASIGRCYFWSGEYDDANVNQHVCIIRPNEKVKTSYLFYAMSSKIGQAQIDIEQTGAGREGLNFAALKTFTFSITTIEEQQAIVDFLNDKTAKINEHKGKIEAVIARLQEYRSALITNAVTGKIDVRNFRLPEAEELVNHG